MMKELKNQISYAWLVAILAGVFLFSACTVHKIAPPAAPAAKPTKQKWIIDTDVAIDDWPAIFFMLNHPQVEVIGITITGCGETHAEPGVQNTMNLCLLAGQGHIPAAAAHPEPLDGYHIYPTPWRTMANTLSGISIPQHQGLKTPMNALELMSHLLRNSPEKVNILSLGPLTNISEVFEKEPDLTEKVGKLVIMGGAVRVKGNILVPGFTDHLKNKVAEWNIYIDPVAARKVFRSRVPKVLVPLDATNQVQVTFAFVDDFKKRSKSPEAKFMCRVFDKETEFIKSGEFFFWDPLAAALGVEEDLGKYEHLKMDVVVLYTDAPPLQKEALGYSKRLKHGGPRQNFDYHGTGRTVIADTGGLTKVCVRVDGDRFKERYIRVINKEEKQTAASP
jgi:inosine-uridine nucleoside N-ribohydrolase